MGRRQAKQPDRLILTGNYPPFKFAPSRDFAKSPLGEKLFRFQYYRLYSVLAGSNLSHDRQTTLLFRETNFDRLNKNAVDPQLYLLSHWHAYLQAQVHYDLIFTEKVFIEDRIGFEFPEKEYNLVTMPVPGRSAFEKLGLLIALTDRSIENPDYFYENLRSHFHQLLMSDQYGREFPGRYDFVRKLGLVSSGRKKEACKSLNFSSYKNEVRKLESVYGKTRLDVVNYLENICRN